MRKTNTGPMIRYQSMRMPVMVLSDSSRDKKTEEDKINSGGSDETKEAAAQNESSTSNAEK